MQKQTNFEKKAIAHSQHLIETQFNSFMKKKVISNSKQMLSKALKQGVENNININRIVFVTLRTI